MLKKTIVLCLFLFVVVETRAQTVQDYIDAHLETAQNLMHIYKVPASIVLGVAIHESAAGKSKIARYLNNHFGVKGENSSTEIQSAYRGYESAEASYAHFAEFLMAKPAYSKLFGLFSQYDYQNWARGIQRGGYAHSRTWASQVIGLIKKYELYKYDERPDDYIEKVLPAAEPVRTVKTKTKVSPAKKSGLYTVKKGDNLNKLAEARGTTAAALMKKNNLRSAALQPGQKIKL